MAPETIVVEKETERVVYVDKKESKLIQGHFAGMRAGSTFASGSISNSMETNFTYFSVFYNLTLNLEGHLLPVEFEMGFFGTRLTDELVADNMDIRGNHFPVSFGVGYAYSLLDSLFVIPKAAIGFNIHNIDSENPGLQNTNEIFLLAKVGLSFSYILMENLNVYLDYQLISIMDSGGLFHVPSFGASYQF